MSELIWVLKFYCGLQDYVDVVKKEVQWLYCHVCSALITSSSPTSTRDVSSRRFFSKSKSKLKKLTRSGSTCN